MSAPAARRTVAQLWKQGWNEIPEVMGSSMFALMGFGLAFYIHHRYYKYEMYNHRFKDEYIVYRPDDPHVPKMRIFEDSPPRTSVGSAGKKC